MVSLEEVMQRLESEIRKNQKRMRHEPQSLYDLQCQVDEYKKRLYEANEAKDNLKNEYDNKLAI